MRIIFFVVTFILLIAGTFVYPASRDYIIKKTIEFAVSSGDSKLKIDSLQATGNKITLTGTNFFLRNIDAIKIDDITIDYSLDEILKDKHIIMHINIGGKASILGADADIAANINYSATSLEKYNIAIKIDKLSSSIFGEMGLNPLQGACNIITTQTTHHISNCNITDGSTHLATEVKSDFSNSGLESLVVKGSAKELPVDFHKLFHHLITENDTMKYLYDNISGAKVKNGSWELNLPTEFFSSLKMKPEYLNGTFNIENIALNYDPDFPAIEKINATLSMKGSLLDLQILSAYTHNTKLENASVLIDWGVEGDTNVAIKADAKGPAGDLTDYIPKPSLKMLAESGIDVTKFTGQAISKVSIIIPISPVKNTYDITTNISNAELAIFNKNIIMSNGKLAGSFDGKHVKFAGKCAINGFGTNIDFTNNFDEKEEFDNILNLKINLAKQDTGGLVPLYSFGEGNALLDISYKDKNNKGQFSAKSNLTNISFDIAKLGIHNMYSDKAILEAQGKTDENGNFPIDISLNGTNIKIIGLAIISPEMTKLSFSKIVSNDTNIKADIEIAPQSVKTNISGRLIDLSRANMMQFLTKDASNTAMDVKAKFDVVRLKNDVYLDHFILSMKCSRSKCSEGIMNANIGSKEMNFFLYPFEDHEEWKINITNAGAAFKGLDMINNIKAGELSMLVKTNISKAEAGKTVPIAEGDFSLKKFVTVDNKILTRLVSFVSLPGIMSAIRNNKNISFSEMKGKFSYKDNLISIYDGNATGPFLDLTITGSIFTDEHKVKIKGTVIPSLYGINQMVNKIPVLGTIFGGKHRKGIFSAPYSIEYKY